MTAEIVRKRLLYQDASVLVHSLETEFDESNHYLLRRQIGRVLRKARTRKERRLTAFLDAYDAQPAQRPPFPIVSAAIAEHGAAILTKEGFDYVRNC